MAQLSDHRPDAMPSPHSARRPEAMPSPTSDHRPEAMPSPISDHRPEAMPSPISARRPEPMPSPISARRPEPMPSPISSRLPEPMPSPISDSIKMSLLQSLLLVLKQKLATLRAPKDEFYQKQCFLNEEYLKLQEEFQVLGDEIFPVDEAVEDFERQISITDSLIPFVAMIETAHQYFDLREYVNLNYDFKNILLPPEIAYTLLQDEELKSKFDKIGEFEIRHIAYSVKLENQLRAWGTKEEEPILRHPIYNLVFQARKDYVMDRNPIVELEKLMKSDPDLYDAYFRFPIEPMDYSKSLKTEVDACIKYAQFWPEDVKAASGAEPAVEKAEDVARRMLAKHNETLEEKRQFLLVLKDNLETLNVQINELRKKQNYLEAEFLKLQEGFQEPRDEIYSVEEAISELERRISITDALVPFVATIEAAHQYFDVKKYRKENHDFKNIWSLQKINNTLCQDVELKSKFNKIGQFEIRQIAHAIKMENESQACRTKQEEDPALCNPIYKLVFQTREEGYVLDQNPIVELEKIMESHQDFYDAHLRFLELPMECSELITEEDARRKYCQLRRKDKEEGFDEKHEWTSSTATDVRSKQKRPMPSTEVLANQPPNGLVIPHSVRI